MSASVFDVIIIGGGPAGLNAALVLGRCCRHVLLLDDRTARNSVSSGVHGFLGHDGISPAALRDLAHAQLAPYAIEVRHDRVTHASREDGVFVVTDASGRTARARKMLLATGVNDRLPDLPGAKELYGRGLYPCVYCDGWELRGKPLAAFGGGGAPCVEFALGLTTWTRDIILFTNGDAVEDDHRARLGRYGVSICTEKVAGFVGDEKGLSHVRLENGDDVPRAALFLHLGQSAHSPLAKMLGCDVQGAGVVDTFDKQRTSVPGLYLAGDASHDVKFAIVAAAHGARAAHDINQVLRQEDTP